MSNTDFWKHIDSIIAQGFDANGLKQLEELQNYSSPGGLFINDFHRSNSMAAQREAAIMSLHPYSQEQVLTQVASLQHSRS